MRKRSALLDYARPDNVSLKVAPILDARPPILKEVPEAGPMDCQPPEEDEPPSMGGGVLASQAPPADPPPAEALPVKEIVQPEPQAPPAAAPKVTVAHAASPPATVPKKFGSYELIWEISKDAISTTWAVNNPAFEGMLALRIFNERITDSAQVRSIQKAAQKSSELTHPNHAAVYDNGLGENGTPYVVSEWIEGEPLSELFRNKKRLDIATFLNIFGQINEVLAEAHSKQLMHGNLSPQKIILAANEIDADMVKVIDFGMPVDPVQNAFYMSPEQCIDNSRADARSDIYSVGCMMYESLVGRPPALGSTTQSSVDFLHELANQYSKDSQEHQALKLLDCIIKRCLQKKASNRFTSVRELMSALDLVADCFNHPGTRKLPRDAEKLLLFRFLNFFDKKITAILTAYLLLGLCATKYIGELQLQRYIDDGQLARNVDWPRAQTNFSAALSQADLLGKPPSLKADLHWELGDAYMSQANSAGTDVVANNLSRQAIDQYQQAYQYFKNGNIYRSSALTLQGQIAKLWFDMKDDELVRSTRNLAISKAEGLWNAKNYSACAKLAEAYLSKHADRTMEWYARRSLERMAKSVKPEKAIYLLARASFYQQDHNDPAVDKSIDDQMNKAMEKLKVHWQLNDTHLHYACKAVTSGDYIAAAGFLRRSEKEVSQALASNVGDYIWLRRQTYARVDKDPSLAAAIKPLERQLEITEKAFGKLGELNATGVDRLAECYRVSGQADKACQYYKKLFELVSPSMYEYRRSVLAYADLLSAAGKNDEAIKILESAVDVSGSVDANNPLTVRLLGAYGTGGKANRAIVAFENICRFPEAVKYDPRYVFGEEGDIIRSPEDVAQARLEQSTDPFAYGADVPESTAKKAPKTKKKNAEKVVEPFDPHADNANLPPNADSSF